VKKKKILTILIFLIVVTLGALIFYFKLNFKNNNSLTIEEGKWIDQNKQNIIDVALLNDIPMLSYDGEGYMYDYLDFVSKETALKFNVITYKLDVNTEYDYKMEITNKVTNDDIKIYKDNLVLVTFDDVQYTNVNEINNLKLGILSSDKDETLKYLDQNNLNYVEYPTYAELKSAIISSKTATEADENTINGIIVLKSAIIKEVVENQFNIAFHFNDLNRYYVLKINNNNLKNILNKKFNIWKKSNLTQKSNTYLLNNYFKFKNITDVEQKTLKSKNYKFGFINYGIYNYLEGKELTGFNGLLLKKFIEFSGLSLTYTQYNSINKLIEDFNSNKIDFMFNLVDQSKYKNNITKSVSLYDKNLVVVSHNNSNIVIDSLKSLKNKEVLTIKDSYIEDYLKNNSIKFKSYNNINDLIKDFNVDDIVIIELENYNFYKTKTFKDSRISYFLTTNDKYNFVINDTDENKLFNDLFDFYLSYNSINKLTSVNYDMVVKESHNIVYILVIIIGIFGLYIFLDFNNHVKAMLKTVKKKKKEKLTKEEKLKYIDQLTSLKNRNYLNSKIEEWDESEIYPQSIIIIDLNNISYINDNFGREEGDKVIAQAANVLIQNQLSNSEIIRTDGNEFLIYLVGYTEKQIISYLRKLNREFKNLSHGFGIASGYSLITDAIKTVDDAVNEATLAMKENKEDIEY